MKIDASTRRAGGNAPDRVRRLAPTIPEGCRLPYYIAAERRKDGRVRVDGRWLIDFSSNDYLGLSRDRRVTEAAAEAVLRHGAGAGSAAILGGALELHETLQHELAAWLQQDAALLFPSGFQACMGTVLALGERNRLLLDREAHASLTEGARIARRGMRRFSTADTARLERLLLMQDEPADAGTAIVVDGVYSMSGRICPLGVIQDLAERCSASVVVDEAHSLGILGEGRGAVHATGCEGRGIIQVGTFSKALGACGGYVAGPEDIVLGIRSACPQAVFTAALAPSLCAAALESLRILRSEPERSARVRSRAGSLRRRLCALGVPLAVDATEAEVTPIVPVPVASEREVFLVWQRLFDRGIYSSPVLPPACPGETPMLRLSLNWGHSEGDVEVLASALAECL